jgi:alpha-glucosidase
MSNHKVIALGLIIIAGLAGVSCRVGVGPKVGPFTVSSPDGNLTITLALEAKPQPYLPGERAYYSVTYKGAAVPVDSPLGLDFLGASPLDQDFEVVATDRKSNNSTWENTFGARRTVPDHYNEMTVSLREKKAPGRRVELVFRAYDEGVAFRYVLPKQEALGEFTLAAENTGFYFAGATASETERGAGSGVVSPSACPSAFALNMGRFNTQNEGKYLRISLRDIKPASIINLPLLVEMPGGPWVALLEADLTDYAGMYVGGVPGIPNALAAKLSTSPDRKAEQAVVGTTPKATPWRILMVAPTPGRLIETN